VSVSARLEGEGHVRFSVRDTGIGIPGHMLGALFEDFVQVDSPIQKRLRGTGLGLALCRRFAELLGGSVGVSSTLGEGSEFHVILPIKLKPEGADDGG
jgi:signal transduction histidine kinase